MIPLKIHQPILAHLVSRITPLRSFLSHPHSPIPQRPRFSFKPNPLCFSPSQIQFSNSFKPHKVSELSPSVRPNEEDDLEHSAQLEDLSPDGAVYRRTLALVECSMFAALTGLVYFLSNSLAIEVR